MGPEKLQKISITREEIREVYDQGPEAIEALVLSLVDTINKLIDRVDEQDKIIKVQDARIKKLEDQINKNSRNSSKPPSTDSPYRNKKKKKNNLQGRNKKRVGTTLAQVANPDGIVICEVALCEHCQENLSDIPVLNIEKRQVTDIPPVKAYTTEYQGEIKQCPHCHQITKATFPQEVTHAVQYGPIIQAMAVYLRNYQLLPLERTTGLFKDLFGISLSEGFLVNMTTRCAESLSGFIENLKSKLIGAQVLHNDETGVNINGTLRWIHTAGNSEYTYLFPHKKRGSDASDEMGILPHYKGVSVHDFWKPYEQYDCTHAYCNAHILRELIFASENHKQAWAADMIDLLLEIKDKVDLSPTHHLAEDEVSLFLGKYNRLITQGYTANPPPERTGKRGRPRKGKVLALIHRMDLYQHDILRFMSEGNVPFTNNLAERDLRMIKVRQKISGTFKNIDRASDFCSIRSYLSTVQKQGKDILEALANVFKLSSELTLGSL
ncbi:MAG: IS66 family transposase [Spirochaetaceae bacterium]|nr:IS66 family transposase [Spirochaetaceae bacterium]